jgi:hypothetical protein
MADGLHGVGRAIGWVVLFARPEVRLTAAVAVELRDHEMMLTCRARQTAYLVCRRGTKSPESYNGTCRQI